MVNITTHGKYIEYIYDYNNNLVRKVIPRTGTGVTLSYEENRLIYEIRNGNKSYFLYDENDILYGIIYNNITYFYTRDILGTITGLVNEQGVQVVNYEYDAWGRILSTTGSLQDTLGYDNPFRYKSMFGNDYYYDVDSELYYCATRWYNPLWCRFISGDDIRYFDSENIGCVNMFAYCNNNPVMYADPSGHFVISALIIGLVFGFAGTMLTDWLDDGEIFNGSQDWKDYIGNTLAGGIGGLAGAFGLNMLGSIVFSVAGDTIGGLFSGDINSWETFGKTVALSIGMSIFSSGISSAVSDAFGTSQYKAIRGVSGKNIKVNNYIKGLKGSFKRAGVTALKIGRNSMDDFLKALRKTTSNVVITEISGNLVSTSIGIWF